MSQQSVFHQVMATVEERKAEMPAKSYVVKLLKAGTDAICCKLAEETGEVIKAAREEERIDVIKEVADLYFHSYVLLAQKNIALSEIEAELARRHGISGIDEKAARTQK